MSRRRSRFAAASLALLAGLFFIAFWREIWLFVAYAPRPGSILEVRAFPHDHKETSGIHNLKLYVKRWEGMPGPKYACPPIQCVYCRCDDHTRCRPIVTYWVFEDSEMNSSAAPTSCSCRESGHDLAP